VHLVGLYYKNHGFFYVSESRTQTAYAKLEGVRFARYWFEVFE